MAAKIYLPVTERQDGDTVLNNTGKSASIFRGDEPDENLACGSCKQVIGRNISTATVFERLRPKSRLVLHCICGAHVLLPSNPI